MSRKYTPMGSRLLIRMTQQKGVSAGGIYLPNQSSSTEGTIEAVGPDCPLGWDADARDWNKPLFCVGQRVQVDPGEPRRGVGMGEPDLVLVKAEHVLCVVTEAEEEN